MKKSSLLKFVGAILIAAGAFFTPVTSITKAGPRCVTNADCTPPLFCDHGRCVWHD
jgi:hypothetical protein